MSLLAILVALVVSIAVIETKERTASLVVLPPLVLGYDELYKDLKEEKNATKSKTLRSSPDFIDTKGRRTFDSNINLGSIFKEPNSGNVEKQPTAENIQDDINLSEFQTVT